MDHYDFYTIADSPEKIEEDWEIQNFGRELTLSREEGGCGLLVGKWKQLS